MDSKFARDRFVINRKSGFFNRGENYYVYDEQQNTLLYVPNIFEKTINICEDDATRTPLLKILPVTFLGRFSSQGHRILEDNQGVKIATFQEGINAPGFENFFQELVGVLDSNGKLKCKAIETNVVMRFFRGFVFHGNTNFNLLVVNEDGHWNKIGVFSRRDDKPVLDLAGDPNRSFDRRVAVALCILLDSIIFLGSED